MPNCVPDKDLLYADQLHVDVLRSSVLAPLSGGGICQRRSGYEVVHRHWVVHVFVVNHSLRHDKDVRSQ